MKKIFAIACTAILVVAMLTSTAFAGSIAPVYWDLEIDTRKADAANVKKDGIIGENEYEKIDVDGNLLWMNHNTNFDGDGIYEDLLAKAQIIRDSVEYYFSWDETNGLNFAVRYKPVEWKSDVEKANDETSFFTPAGGLLIQIYTGNTKEEGLNNVLYYMIGKNSNGQLLTMGYDNQSGYPYDPEWKNGEGKVVGAYVGGYTAEEGKNVAVAYDEATGYVTYEVSIPLSVALKNADDKSFNFNISIFSGGNASKSWDGAQGHFSLALGQWGFFMDQLACTGGKATTVTLSDVAVGYVEPEPTPTTAPTEAPKATEAPKTEEGGVDTWMIVAIIGWVVAVVFIALTFKKKK